MPNATPSTISEVEPPAGDLWSMSDIAAATGLTVGTVRWHKWQGHLPKPDQVLSRRTPGWRKATIWPWIQERKH